MFKINYDLQLNKVELENPTMINFKTTWEFYISGNFSLKMRPIVGSCALRIGKTNF